MPRSVLLLLSVYLLAGLVSAATNPEDCLKEDCSYWNGPDCSEGYRKECQYWIDLHGEPYFLQHKTNCSRFWLCEPSDFSGINLCLFECAPCAPWPEVTSACPDHALEFDWTIKYPAGPVCNWPAMINCTGKACPLPCQVPDANGVCHPECCVDDDCRGDTPICDADTNTCVPGCRLDSECDNWDGICPTCQWCNKPDGADTGKCEPGCLTDAQCKDPTPICHDHQCVKPDCEYPCCNQHTDCHGYDTLCEIPPWNTDPSCEYCNSNGQDEGKCTPGCIDTHDKCPTDYTCDGNHECQPDCEYPCCKKGSDCQNYNTACSDADATHPDDPSKSCEYCTADDGTKGECTPGCVPENDMCTTLPGKPTCAGDHNCQSGGTSYIKEITVVTKECKGCSEDMANEGGAVLTVTGTLECQEGGGCICTTNGLDNSDSLDYIDGGSHTFYSERINDHSSMGQCYHASMVTENVTVSWNGKEGSIWYPEEVSIKISAPSTKHCTPFDDKGLTPNDLPIQLNCK